MPEATSHFPFEGEDSEETVPAAAEQEAPPTREPGRRRATPRRERGNRASGCLAVLVALAIVGGLGWFGASKGYEWLSSRLEGAPADYPGPGTGQVTVEVGTGDSATAIGQTLQEAGVVQSVDAFVDAANENPDSAGIQVGFYTLRKEMKASDALEVLIDPKNLVQTMVTIPEGLRTVDILDRLAAQTDFPRRRFAELVEAPGQIGLPAQARGSVEGYLFPATYSFGPNARPKQMLTAMVDRWKQAAADNDLEGGAAALGYTPQEVMTVASLVQSEGRTPEDMARIARVIYNRLENPSEQGTGGRLQIDATVDYALGRKLTVGLTNEERQSTQSPYNTYVTAGLPPGPISSPGDDAIQAALNPVPGDWYFYVTVDLESGETKFAETYDEFQGYWQELRDYCASEQELC